METSADIESPGGGGAQILLGGDKGVRQANKNSEGALGLFLLHPASSWQHPGTPRDRMSKEQALLFPLNMGGRAAIRRPKQV